MSLDQITKADVEVIFDLVPYAKDALQGMDAENLRPLWEQAALAVELEFDVLGDARTEIQRRVADAVRALEYGERVA